MQLNNSKIISILIISVIIITFIYYKNYGQYSNKNTTTLLSNKIISINFLQNQPISLTQGSDNSLKMWIYDQMDGTGRLLRSRCGHTLPPCKIKYYGGTTLATTADGSTGKCCPPGRRADERLSAHRRRDQCGQHAVCSGRGYAKARALFATGRAARVFRGPSHGNRIGGRDNRI